jgi:hypothetical protein
MRASIRSHPLEYRPEQPFLRRLLVEEWVRLPQTTVPGCEIDDFSDPVETVPFPSLDVGCKVGFW